MQRMCFLLPVLLISLAVSYNAANAKNARVDEAAPDFSLTDANAKKHSLSDFKGKWVVLEWVNFGCPYVRKHYDSCNMQSLQKAYTSKKDVAWLSVCSSAPGRQGYYEGEDLVAQIKEEGSFATAYLIDSEGTVGKTYEAKTTPHMYIINPEGVLVYAGGIDNIASSNKDDIKKATNYVRETLDAAMAGKEIAVKGSRPYGCSVKYK
ncbi:MAG: Thiol-disulfide isomerase/thioredoxin domain protein [Bacteroidetes bacterium]|nr:Thiol-disulfide isomerase/thioredoxin domain protein [Bacteroidota bacterium]